MPFIGGLVCLGALLGCATVSVPPYPMPLPERLDPDNSTLASVDAFQLWRLGSDYLPYEQLELNAFTDAESELEISKLRVKHLRIATFFRFPDLAPAVRFTCGRRIFQIEK